MLVNNNIHNTDKNDLVQIYLLLQNANKRTNRNEGLILNFFFNFFSRIDPFHKNFKNAIRKIKEKFSQKEMYLTFCVLCFNLLDKSFKSAEIEKALNNFFKIYRQDSQQLLYFSSFFYKRIKRILYSKEVIKNYNDIISMIDFFNNLFSGHEPTKKYRKPLIKIKRKLLLLKENIRKNQLIYNYVNGRIEEVIPFFVNSLNSLDYNYILYYIFTETSRINKLLKTPVNNSNFIYCENYIENYNLFYKDNYDYVIIDTCFKNLLDPNLNENLKEMFYRQLKYFFYNFNPKNNIYIPFFDTIKYKFKKISSSYKKRKKIYDLLLKKNKKNQELIDLKNLFTKIYITKEEKNLIKEKLKKFYQPIES